MEIVMQWNVLCMKIFEAFFLTNKNSINFRVQAIIILFDHQHVDIMFFFQITMMTMTKQKFHFLKGAKFLFHWSFSAKFDVIIFFKKWVVYTHHNKLKFVFFKLCFVQLGLFCNGILTSFKRVEILIIIFQFSKASTPKVFFFDVLLVIKVIVLMTYILFLKGAELKGRVFDSTWFIFLHSFNFSIARFENCKYRVCRQFLLLFWLEFVQFKKFRKKQIFLILFFSNTLFFHETFQEINSRKTFFKKRGQIFMNFLG